MGKKNYWLEEAEEGDGRAEGPPTVGGGASRGSGSCWNQMRVRIFESSPGEGSPVGDLTVFAD